VHRLPEKNKNIRCHPNRLGKYLRSLALDLQSDGVRQFNKRLLEGSGVEVRQLMGDTHSIIMNELGRRQAG